MNYQETPKKDFEALPILADYQNDERLLRYANRLDECYMDERIDWEELMAEHRFEAYWQDLGGEGGP